MKTMTKARATAVLALLELAAATVEGETLANLLDIADRLYVRYDCGFRNSCDLVLPYLGERSACIEQAVKRRMYFIGA